MNYLLYFTKDKEYFYSTDSDNNIQPISDFSKATELSKHTMLIDVISNAKEIVTSLKKLGEIIVYDNYNSKTKEVKDIYNQLSKYSILFNNFENVILKKYKVGEEKRGKGQGKNREFSDILLIKDNLPLLIDKVNLYSNIDMDIEEKYKNLSNEIKLAIKKFKDKRFSLTTDLPTSADTYLIKIKGQEVITYEEYLATLLRDTFQKLQKDSYYKFKDGEPFENAFHNKDYQYVEPITSISTDSKEYKEIENAISKQKFINATYYQCDNIWEIFNVLFYQYKISKDNISKCANCGKYFIVENGHEKFCNRPIFENSNKTCKDVGKNKLYRESLKLRPAKLIHEKNGQYYRVKIKRAIAKGNKEEEKLYTSLKEKYYKQYDVKLKAFNNKTLSEEEFINWLNGKGVNDNGNKRNSKK